MLTPEQLFRIEALAGGIVAEGGRYINGLQAADVLALVQAYRTAQTVGRIAYLALLDHDTIKARNQLLELPGVSDLAEGRTR